MPGNNLAEQIAKLSMWERRVIQYLLERKQTARNPNKAFDQSLTPGQRIADAVAAFGGSWTFIIIFLSAMTLWMLLNALERTPFDPFPFILLNLILSCLAALQAPVIMMSQNRQSAKDRLDAQHDYEVNLKAELEVLGLHTKLDALRDQELVEIHAALNRQAASIEKLAARIDGSVEGSVAE